MFIEVTNDFRADFYAANFYGGRPLIGRLIELQHFIALPEVGYLFLY